MPAGANDDRDGNRMPMSTDDSTSRGFSLRRWSQRKLEVARAAEARAPDAAASAARGGAPAQSAAAPAPSASAVAAARRSAVEDAGRKPPPRQPQDAASLPPVESLTIDSDFSAFLDPKVDEGVKLQALKKLFSDPRFNVMDGLDIYIDDYSIADPLAPDLARQLAHARYIFDPPRTRVNEAGIVEEVPADEAAADADAAPREALPESRAAPPESRATSSAEVSPNPEPEKAAESGANAAQPIEGSEPARQ